MLNKLLAIIILSCLVLASCSQTCILGLKYRPRYWEKNTLVGTKTIQQKIFYDNRHWSDAFYCRTLTINIIDSITFRNKKTINIEIDTLIATCSYNYSYAWEIGLEPQKNITGKLTLVDWNSRQIKVSMDLIVNKAFLGEFNSYRPNLIYKGTRTFKK